MLKPTQDEQAIQATKEAIYFNITPISDIGGAILMESINIMVNRILQRLEELGYHKGLPPSIEEALNSGDGVYRP